MSPAEAGEIIEEPDWIELWDALKGADDGFEVILTKWRRWHWTPGSKYRNDHGQRRVQKLPAPAVDGIIALAGLGIMPTRTLIPGHEGYQHDDHMFLMSQGREWRIVGVESRMLILKSDGDEWQIDLSRAKWDDYIIDASAALEERRI